MVLPFKNGSYLKVDGDMCLYWRALDFFGIPAGILEKQTK
jgi:hypothetical protein